MTKRVLLVLFGGIIVSAIFSTGSALAATGSFDQTNWSGGATSHTASSTDNQTGWTEYNAKDSSTSVVNAGADLQIGITSQTITQTSDANSNAGFNLSGSATASTSITGSGNSASVVLQTVASPATAQIVTGGNHACSLKSDGTVFCWGLNTSGQLGNNTNTQSTVAGQVLDSTGNVFLSNIVQIDAGTNFTCALTSTGEVYCWGDNGYGQLGNNSVTATNLPVQVHGVGDSGFISGISQIALSADGVCALVAADGSLLCWGAGLYGQIGNGLQTNINKTPLAVQDVGGGGTLTGVAQVGKGNKHTCAVKTDHTAYCWGQNTNGKLGDNTVTLRTTPVQVHGVFDSGMLADVAQISPSDGHFTCARKTDGTAFCWGLNSSGQLGLNSTTATSTPAQVLGVGGTGTLTDVAQITVGNAYACAVKTDGTVFCWGLNTYGPLGDGSRTQRNAPVQVIGVGSAGNLTSVAAVDALSATTCASKTDGTVYCWGYGSEGQLGVNNGTGNAFNEVPLQVLDKFLSSMTLFGVTQVEAATHHSCALKADGTVYCWGNAATTGAIGDNTIVTRRVPVQVHGVSDSGYLTGITAISSAHTYNCAVGSGGAVYCWGANGTYGLLGNNSTAQSNVPVQVHGLSDSGMLSGVSQVVTGEGHACALIASNGSIVCWGYGGYGELGNAGTASSKYPVQVVDVGGSGTFTGAIQISAGSNGTCAVKSDYTVYCWGRNSNGFIGDGTKTQRTSPVQVHGVDDSGMLTDVAQVSISTQTHTCAVKTNNSVFCWGNNTYGQVGNAATTATGQVTPVQVHGVNDSGMLADVVEVSAGAYSTCARKTDGTSYCWGDNSSGQLGDTSVTQRTTPVQVVGVGGTGTLASVSDIDIGNYTTCAAKTDRTTVYCWGTNPDGQVGDNSVTAVHSPVQVYNQLPGFMYLLGGTNYHQYGTYTSGPIDTAGSVVLADTVSWASSGSGYIFIKARTDADGDFSNATAWSSCAYLMNGSALTYSNCATAGHRYIQYQVELYSTLGSTPSLDSVSLTYSSYASSGTLTSSAFDTESSIGKVNSLLWTEDASLPANTTVTVSLRTAATSAGLTGSWTDFTDATTNCTPSSGTVTCTTDAIPAGLKDGTGDQWVQYKVALATSNGLSTPTLGQVILGYDQNIALAPTVTSVTGQNPQTTLGGKAITINGTGFTATPTVTIGGASATDVTWVSATELSATAPATTTAGTAVVVVTNPDAQSGTCADCLTYTAPPTVSNASPNTDITTAGGTTVTLTGTGMKVGAGGAVVDPSGTADSVTTAGSASSATFTTPVHAAGTVSLRVYGPSGTVANGIYYDYSSLTFATPAAPAEETPAETTPAATVVTHRSSGSTIGNQYANLIAMGKFAEAEALKRQWPQLFPLSAPTILKNAFTRDLRVGSIGEDVRQLQIFLNTHGYLITSSGLGSVGKETTKFGALTRQALIRFQKANKIVPAVGYFGPITRAKINAML